MPALARHQSRYVRFRIDRYGTGAREELVLFVGLYDDLICPQNGRMQRIAGIEQGPGPAFVRAHAAVRGDYLGGDQMRAAAQPPIKASGDSETDDAPAGRVRQRLLHGV